MSRKSHQAVPFQHLNSCAFKTRNRIDDFHTPDAICSKFIRNARKASLLSFFFFFQEALDAKDRQESVGDNINETAQD